MQKSISADISSARQKYQAVQEFRTQLMILRDKYLAHSDKDIFMDVESFSQEVSLKREALEKLIQTAADILNTLLSDLSDTVVHIKYHNADDYRKLLHYVQEGKEYYLQRVISNNNHDN